jgi:hypothetical protein
MQPKKIVMMLILLFAAIYYLARIGIFYLGLSGEMNFEEEQSELVEGAVLYSFLAIGVIGLIMLPGLYLGRSWGFWGTIVVSLYTIVFDTWAYAMVQVSAAAGVIPASVLLAYLVLTRKDWYK